MDRFYNFKVKNRLPVPGRISQGDEKVKKTDSGAGTLAGTVRANDIHPVGFTNSTGTPSTRQLSTINVVLFGETGVGRSSVINLIAQDEVAKVSSDAVGCTMESTRYTIPFDGLNFAIFDTIGLETPEYGVNGYLNAIEKAYELVKKLGAAGGVHLLLFCLRGGRLTATTRSNYRLFCEYLCHGGGTKVPIALVFTGLEGEDDMGDWWRRNKAYLEQCGMKSDAQACVTAVRGDTPGEDLKFTESQKKIRELLKNYPLKDDAFVLETQSWFANLGRRMLNFIAKHKSPKNSDVLTVLMKRCKLDSDTAKRIAGMMKKGDPETKDPQGGVPTNPTTDAGQRGNGVERKGIPPQREFSDPPSESEDSNKPAAGHSSDPRRHNSAEARFPGLKRNEANRGRLRNAGAVENDVSLVQKPSDTSNESKNANKPAAEHLPHLKQHNGGPLGSKENEADRGRLRDVGTAQNDVPLVQEPGGASNESKDANKPVTERSLHPKQHSNAEAGLGSLGLRENEACRNRAMNAEAVGKGISPLPEISDTSSKSEDANKPTTEHPPYPKRHRIAQAGPLEPKKGNEADSARVRAAYGYSSQPQEGNVPPNPGSRNNEVGRKKTNFTPFPVPARSALDQRRGLNTTSQWSAVSNYGWS